MHHYYHHVAAILLHTSVSLFDDGNVPTPGLVSQSGNEASAGFTEAHSEAFLTQRWGQCENRNTGT